MQISTLDLFKIGIGPSSSHTVGPMRAAFKFASSLDASGLLDATEAITVGLYGSLGATGLGHSTDKGVVLGLMGQAPDTIDPDTIDGMMAALLRDKRLALMGKREIAFVLDRDVVFLPEKTMPGHPNGLQFEARDNSGAVLRQAGYLSVGGGFVINADEAGAEEVSCAPAAVYPFNSADELLALCARHQLSIAQLMMANENGLRPESQTRAALMRIWEVMRACVQRGMKHEGVLPGPLGVRRRAPALFTELQRRANTAADTLSGMDWLTLYAMAVNEENAAGGRVVTAPTNGAAGILPAVLHYHQHCNPDLDAQSVIDFFLTAGAIGSLYKMNASISGAAVGCQGEVGVACSMAAGALCAIMGGTAAQVENAAEIGMEHNLGLTCDPVGGLVQIPCIERNAMGAVKAVNAARLALRGDGAHHVSLDAVIRTMRQTGADMDTKYKETSRGGLAVNIIEC
ncbi:L-serine ammonia-lyase [Allopusillimonas ginsengisoli]|uniref:L-serine ammonia-lyase n=1 Tax=Allopusillimonas ginsengisoli TaxID=453575 RepID=UPI001022254E|nr:L-serine ammonia-lyase [Allopusillimonas ginsengisoli]TEA78952.1 L-serine ammonia-lyase [Allopusillimonas ginsengisoli]